MSLENRRWLSWSEAAVALGFDREGLMQEFEYRASEDPSDLWLPVFVRPSPHMYFFGAFAFDDYERIELFHAQPWNDESLVVGPRNFYWYDFRECIERARKEGVELFTLDNEGATPTASWKAISDNGTRWQSCFRLYGSLVLAPEAVAAACEGGGSFEGLLPTAAPVEWCNGYRFPREYFRIEDDEALLKAASAFEGRPVISVLSNLEECAFFRGADVRRAAALLAEGESKSIEKTSAAVRVLEANSETLPSELSPARQASRIRPQREQNLLRVIAGLWALSDLPDAHNSVADKLSALFDSWGWDGPAKSTIADTILKHAASLPKIKT